MSLGIILVYLYIYKQLCSLSGMEVLINTLRWPLEDRVDDGTVDLTETSSHYAVTKKYMLVILEFTVSLLSSSIYIYIYIYRWRCWRRTKNCWFTVTFIQLTTCFGMIHFPFSSLSYNRAESDINRYSQPNRNYIN